MRTAKNKVISALSAFLILLSQVSAAVIPIEASDDKIYISGRADFLSFAEKCTLDTWSVGKTVVLSRDIDFSGHSFSSVPVFGGEFDGNGHTISGIRIQDKGSYKGVFRCVSESGKIKNLTVKGKFAPGGTESYIGAIAGENSGSIENCAFSGTVIGKNVVGGIAGVNTASGKIALCTATGTVEGESFTGGIAGKNSGFITGCENRAKVNTSYKDKKTDISSIDTDTGAIIENYKGAADENKDDSYLGHSDTGGISGFSDGIIQGCENKAEIGYPHIGYNVGGIAGRQSGYILGCKNNGKVTGRKDVGGICGQAEPYVSLFATESVLKTLRGELSKLNKMVETLVDDAGTLGDDADVYLDNISDFARDAGDSAEKMANIGTDFVDGNLDELNEKAATISNALSTLPEAFDALTDGCVELSDGAQNLADALESVTIYAPDLDGPIDEISAALKEISRSQKDFERSASKLKKAVSNLNAAVKIKNSKDVKNALTDLKDAVSSMAKAKKTIESSLENIGDILGEKPEDFEEVGINTKELAKEIKNIAKSAGEKYKALKILSDSIGTVISNTETDFSKITKAADNAEDALDYLLSATGSITSGISNLSDGLENLHEELGDYADDMTDEVNSAKDAISAAMDSLGFAADDIKDAIAEIRDIISELTDDEPIEFIKLGDDFKEAGDNLFDSLTGISDSVSSLKGVIKDGREKLSGDLTAISNQFNVVMNLLIDGVEEIKDAGRSVSEIFLDVSDEELESTKQGKVKDCENSGAVEADRNTGGIIGCMAIEYSKDPEDDIERPDSLSFTYKTKAVIQSCVNRGNITGKKDCVGGITGYAEIGTVYKCESYADVLSTGGGYVGGIVGKSSSSVRKCSSKGNAEGKRYVGGIAGKGSVITYCNTIFSVTGDEETGAIMGAHTDTDGLLGNRYVGGKLGAVDGISYRGKAEETNYDALKKTDGIPEELISFKVTFMADGEKIRSDAIEYGESTKRIKYPEIPEKKGKYGVWQEAEGETVTNDIVLEAEYKNYLTLISSEEKAEGGNLAIALAEGEFTDKARLYVKESSENTPTGAVGEVKCLDVSLKGTDLKNDESVTVRFLNEDKSRVQSWIKTENGWEKVKISYRGKYVLIALTGTENTVCIAKTGSRLGVVIAILTALACLACAAVIVVKKRKNKNK